MRGGIALVALLFLASCGGAAEPVAPPPPAPNPRTGVIQQIDQLCLDLYKASQNVFWPTDVKEAQRYYERQAEIAREFLDQVDEVEVPEDGKQYIDQMKDYMQKIAAGLDRLANSVSDIERFQELREPLEDLTHKFNVAALRYGLLECSDPAPPRVY